MNRYICSALSTAALALLAATPVHAQATRTWVSGVGDDANPCSRTAPCKTFPGAISKTFINGEINCLDPGAYGAVTITKSITIDCHDQFAGILAAGVTAISINIATGNVNDPQRTVRLRNLNLNGAGSGTRSGLVGVNILNAAVVHIDDLQISDFTQQGIKDARSGGGKLFVNNTTVRNTTLSAIVVGGATPFVSAVIDDSRLFNAGFGIAVANGNTAVVRRSVISGNVTGVETDPGGILSVDDSAISGNDNGVQTLGVIRLSNNDITRNTTAFINGSAITYGNNRILGNTNFGTALIAAGVGSNNLGQQ